MYCPQCHTKKYSIKAGLRHSKEGIIQKYYCKHCQKYYTDKTQPHAQYPLNVILYTLSQYNKGYPVKQVKTLTGKKYRYSPPIRTIYSWIKRYQNTLTFLRLRKQYLIHPNNLITTQRYHHQQIYPFSYHHLKLNLKSKQFPQLKRYINWVERSLPTKIFLNGPRASQCRLQQKTNIQQKKSIASEITRLALSMQTKHPSAHDVVEQFFLINDASTVCTELPVFLNPVESDLFQLDAPLTGHIDLIQIRNNHLFVMDYKPNLNHPERFIGQLLAYREAVHHRTQIPKKQLVMAAFNQYSYVEYQ